MNCDRDKFRGLQSSLGIAERCIYRKALWSDGVIWMRPAVLNAGGLSFCPVWQAGEGNGTIGGRAVRPREIEVSLRSGLRPKRRR